MSAQIRFSCHDLSLTLGEKRLFSHFNFTFEGPGFLLVEGDNGTGKSSFLKLSAGFLSGHSGTVEFSEKLSKGNFSFFTTSSLGLLNDLSGREHIELMARSLEASAETVKEAVKEFSELEIFNELLNKNVSDYSQGMKQLLRLFLHLFFRPKIVMLDEPFLYLSPRVREFLQATLARLATQSLIIVTDQNFLWTPEGKIQKIILGQR